MILDPHNNTNNYNYTQEDEIDLKELFRTLLNNKKTIVFITTLITFIAVIFAFTKTPIYEVKGVVEIGSYKQGSKETLLDDANKLSQELNILYIDILKSEKDRTAWIESISPLKKQNNFIEIKSKGLDNDQAKAELEKLVAYVSAKHEKYIEDVKQQRNYDLYLLDNQISLLKNNQLPTLEEDIEYAKSNLIPSLNQKIKVSEDKLKNLKVQLQIVEQNILKTQTKDATLTALNVLEKRTLESEISSLEVSVIDLKNTLETEKKINLPRLERKKENILNIKIKELMDKRDISASLLKEHNYKNSALIGKVMLNDYPVEPKKKLIVVVAFVTGFILSIFFVFFREFVRNFNEDNQKEENK